MPQGGARSRTDESGTRLPAIFGKGEPPRPAPAWPRYPAHDDASRWSGGWPDEDGLSPWRLPPVLSIFLHILVPLAVLAALAAGAGYVKLLHSPISLAFLAGAIEKGISTELGGRGVRIGGAELALGAHGGLEFRLRNLRISEADGDVIASAPLAAVGLSGWALCSLRLVPVRVDLIEPRISVVVTEEGQVSLGFSSRPGTAGAADGLRARSGPDQGPGADQGPGPAGDAGAAISHHLREVTFTDLLTSLSARLREGFGAQSHLTGAGVRQATVSLDNAGRRTTWYVSHAGVAVERTGARTVISGSLAVDSPRGPWNLSFSASSATSREALVLEASVRDVIPRTLAGAAAALEPLAALDMPVSGDLALDLSPAGDVLGVEAAVRAGQGAVRLPLAGSETEFPLGAAELRAVYNGRERLLTLRPSTVTWGRNRITLAGKLTAADGPGEPSWAFEAAATDGRLAADEANGTDLPIESWEAKGEIVPGRELLRLAGLTLRAGGARIHLAGEAGFGRASGGTRLEGIISPMSLATAKVLWPRAIAPKARRWVAGNVVDGRLGEGRFLLLSGHFLEASALPPGGGARFEMAIGAENVSVFPVTGFPPLIVPRATIRAGDSRSVIDVPDAAFVLEDGARVPLGGVQVRASYAAGAPETGEADFRTAGPVGPVLRLLERKPVELGSRGVPLEGLDGTVEGSFTVAFPLGEPDAAAASGAAGGENGRGAVPSLEGVRISGKATLTEGRGKGAGGAFDVQGARLVFDFEEDAIDMSGELLLNGVLARLNWQHIFDAPPGKQPPLRITSTLGNSDRALLGLDVNHLLIGEVPVEVTVARGAEGTAATRLRADLTNAELLIEGLAWRKPPGRPAILECSLVNAQPQKIELQSVEIKGDGLAIEGHVILDSSRRLQEFHFPHFSLDVVTHLDVRGVLRRDNVLDVKVRGNALDGRNIFRTLFSVGKLAGRDLAPLNPRAGTDVDAEIGTVLGFSEVALHGLRLKMSKRGEKLVSLDGRGTLDGGAPFTAVVREEKGAARRLLAESPDAGQAFKLSGFYPSLKGGRLRLEVALEGQGPAEKTGVLWVDNFRILGDPVATEVFTSAEQAASSNRGASAPKRQTVREEFVFDRMRIGFSVGHGQFVLDDARLTGPLFGVSIHGKADYVLERVALDGTYIPLQWLNNVLVEIPLIGPIASGPRGEGIFGVKFTVEGPMAKPQVLVNPLSLVTPGIFREIFQTNPNPRVSPRAAPSQGPSKSPPRQGGAGGPPAGAKTGRDSGTARSGASVMKGWSSETQPSKETP